MKPEYSVQRDSSDVPGVNAGWIYQHSQKAWEEGCRHPRVSHDPHSNALLFESWKERPDWNNTPAEFHLQKGGVT